MHDQTETHLQKTFSQHMFNLCGCSCSFIHSFTIYILIIQLICIDQVIAVTNASLSIECIAIDLSAISLHTIMKMMIIVRSSAICTHAQHSNKCYSFLIIYMFPFLRFISACYSFVILFFVTITIITTAVAAASATSNNNYYYLFFYQKSISA